MASPEIFDILNKLLKNDDDNATEDVQLLCKLWSGEASSYHFAMGNTRSINANTPFSILGATQIQNAATIIYRMDKGHELLDRFHVTVPMALKPTPQQQEESIQYFRNMPLKDFNRVFNAIDESHTDLTRTCTLDEQAAILHRRLLTDHVNEVNTGIQNGEVLPKSKASDLVARVAVSLNTLIYHISGLLNEQSVNNPPELITEDIYKKSMVYVEYLHSQKDMFTEFLKTIIEKSTESPRRQPTLKFPGTMVTYQAFKKFATRALHSILKPEFENCAEELMQTYDRFVKVGVPRSAHKVSVFIKNKPTDISWVPTSPCSRKDFARSYDQPLNRLITQNIQQAIRNGGHIDT